MTLHFAEIAYEDPARRVFRVAVEGRSESEDIDAGVDGPDRAMRKEFKGVDVRDGFLDIDFVPKVGDPMVSGIEIVGSR